MTFLPVAALLTLTPGAATVLVVHSAARGGRRAALMTTLGNSVGVAVWAVATAVGLAAVVAASAVAFTVVKLVGAVALLWFGIRALVHAGDVPATASVGRRPRSPFRAGLTTSVANPKLAGLVARASDVFLRGGWLRRAERLCGSVLIGLGLRLALEER